ncbi:hypothetical protein D9757_006118 [Collybiopsis confluens]|uniref:C2H2-type domain-containing protein n=1 Tax=Collybiopsis confluens TaxID=2823264 RepID=A0A8H5HHL1_9AGAR|nr:hypothetical protein D9757_006118 [Collybiopsis confluens]
MVFPNPQLRRGQPGPSAQESYTASNEHRTPKQAAFPQNLTNTHTFDYPYSSSSRGNSDFNFPSMVYQDEDLGRRKGGGKQLFDNTDVGRYFVSSSSSSSPLSMGPGEDMSAKVKGKQRSHEDTDRSSIPMSDLRLGFQHQSVIGLRRSRSTQFSRDDSEYVDQHSRKFTTTQSSRTRTRSGKRSVDSEEEEDEESALDQSVEVLLPQAEPPAKASGKKRKVNRYSCPVPSCKETFTRRNDVRRHIRNAAVHRDSAEALALIGETVGAGTRCKYCHADLSRSDARMRHERASACGKRTTQKMKDQMVLMKA